MERNLAIGLETVGCCVILAGIIIEIALKADLGWALTTGGAWIVAIGSLLWGKFFKKI